MPLAAAAAAMGPALAVAAGSVDVAGVAAWTLIGTTICGTLPGCITSFDPTANDPCLSVGPAIAPDTGGFATNAVSAAAFGAALAVSAGSLDAAGIAKWVAIGEAIVSWMGTHGRYSGTGLVAYTGPAPPASGAVTGLGGVSFDDENIGPALATAAGSVDAAGIAKWTAIGAVIIAAIKTSGAIAPGSMANPAVGGPVVGSGSFS